MRREGLANTRGEGKGSPCACCSDSHGGVVLHRACLCGLTDAGGPANRPKEQIKALEPFLMSPGQQCPISSLCFLATSIVCLLQGTVHLSVWERMKQVRGGDSPQLRGPTATTKCHGISEWPSLGPSFEEMSEWTAS